MNSGDRKSLLGRPDSADGCKKDNEFGSNPRMGPSLSCAFGIKRQLTVEERIKLKYLNLCIGQNIIQLKGTATLMITTIYMKDLNKP